MFKESIFFVGKKFIFYFLLPLMQSSETEFINCHEIELFVKRYNNYNTHIKIAFNIAIISTNESLMGKKSTERM